MTKTSTIVLCACVVLAAGAARARAAQQVPTQQPVSQLPDEWKMKKEKDAEAQKKAEADKAAADKAAASQKAAQDKAAQDKAAAQKEAAAKKAAAEKAAGANKNASDKDKKAVDETRPPAVIPADRRPDAWKTEKERNAGGQAGAGKPGVAAADAQKRAASKKKGPWRGWSDRAIVSVNGGWQSSSFDLRDTRDLAPSIQGDRERRTMAAEYAVEPGVAFDFSGVVRAWKGLGAGVSVTRFKDSRDVPVSGTIPHPFFFNQARPVSGGTAGAREETAVHLDAVWVVPVNRRMQIALFGGPTFYSAKQTVVSDYSFSESYPFDDATLTGVTAAEESLSTTGINVGADVGYYFTDVIGVGGVIRFGRGSVDSSLGKLDVGGPEFGVGLRVRIPQGRSTARPATPRPPKTTPPPPPRPRE